MCRFAPEISADKEENRRNPDGFQDFLTQSSGNLWREAVCGDFISGSLKRINRFFSTLRRKIAAEGRICGRGLDFIENKACFTRHRAIGPMAENVQIARFQLCSL
nr:hypothetical protein [uncultured Oscillibacter sp.]